MNTLHKTLRLMCVLLGMMFLPAALLAADKNMHEMAEKIYAQSGMQSQFASFGKQVQTGFDQAQQLHSEQTHIPPTSVIKIKEKTMQVFAPEKFRKPIIDTLIHSLSAEEMRQILAWHASPVGKKCTQAEHEATDEKMLDDLRIYSEQLGENPPDPQRVQLMRDFDSALQATESSATIFLNMNFAISSAAMHASPVKNSISPEELKASLERSRPMLEEKLRQFNLIVFLYTYRNISLEDLREYYTFMQTKLGRKYYKVCIDGMDTALVSCSMAWGKALAEVFEQAPKEATL